MPVLKNIHYLDSGSGKELVLIHGFLGSNSLWTYQIKEFQNATAKLNIPLVQLNKQFITNFMMVLQYSNTRSSNV